MAIRYNSLIMVLGMWVPSLCPLQAKAATPMATFSVTATVLPGCQVSPSITSYRSVAAAIWTAPSAVTVDCNFMTPYDVSVSTGAAAEHESTSGEAGAFRYASPADKLFELSDGHHKPTPMSAHSSLPQSYLSTLPYDLSGRKTELSDLANASKSDTVTVVVTY